MKGNFSAGSLAVASLLKFRTLVFRHQQLINYCSIEFETNMLLIGLSGEERRQQLGPIRQRSA